MDLNCPGSRRWTFLFLFVLNAVCSKCLCGSPCSCQRHILFMPMPHTVVVLACKVQLVYRCISTSHITHCKVVACLSCHCSRMLCPILCNVNVDAYIVPTKRSFGRQSTISSLAEVKSSWRSWLKPINKMLTAIEAPGTVPM